MQNQIQHRALSLTNNLFMNFTTKFVKGLNNPSNNNIQTETNINLASKSLKKVSDQSNINRNLSSLINQPSIVKNLQKTRQVAPLNQNNPSSKDKKEASPDIQAKAMNMTSNVYMNSTTKFVKGSSPKRQNLRFVQQKSQEKIEIPTNQKPQKVISNRNASQHQQVKLSPPRKTLTVKKQNKEEIVLNNSKKNISKNTQEPVQLNSGIFGALLGGKVEQIMDKAMNLTANVYMSSTTKFVKGLAPTKQMQKEKKKFASMNESRSNDRRNRFKTQMVQNIMNKIQNIDNQNQSKSSSRSSSIGRLSRKKQRGRQLKFLQKKDKSDSSLQNSNPSIKPNLNAINKNLAGNHLVANILKGNTPASSRSPVQIVQTAKVQVKNALNPESKVRMVTEVKKIEDNRIKNKGIQSKDQQIKAVQVQKKQEKLKPYSRQNPNVNVVQKKQMTPIQSSTKTYQSQKVIPSIPSGQLPLQTPIKQNKIYPKAQIKSQTVISPKNVNKTEISMIKQQKSSQIGIYNHNAMNKKTNVSQSVKTTNTVLKKQGGAAEVTAINQNFDRLWATPRSRVVKQVKSVQTQRVSENNDMTIEMPTKINKNIKNQKVQQAKVQAQMKTTVKFNGYSRNNIKQTQSSLENNRQKQTNISKRSIKQPQTNKKPIINEIVKKNTQVSENNIRKPVKSPQNIVQKSNVSQKNEKSSTIVVNQQATVISPYKPFERKPVSPVLKTQSYENNTLARKGTQNQQISNKVSQISQKKIAQMSSETNINKNYYQRKQIQSPQVTAPNRNIKQAASLTIKTQNKGNNNLSQKDTYNQSSSNNISRLNDKKIVQVSSESNINKNYYERKQVQAPLVTAPNRNIKQVEIKVERKVVQPVQAVKQPELNLNKKAIRQSNIKQKSEQKPIQQQKNETFSKKSIGYNPYNQKNAAQLKSQAFDNNKKQIKQNISKINPSDNKQKVETKPINTIAVKTSPIKSKEEENVVENTSRQIQKKVAVSENKQSSQKSVKASLNQAKILILSASHIYKNLYLTNLKNFVQQLKKNALGQIKKQKETNNFDKRRQYSIAIIFRILSQKRTENMQHFRLNLWFNSKSELKVNEKNNLSPVIAENKKEGLQNLLRQVNKIRANYYLYHKKAPAFNKILLQAAFNIKKSSANSPIIVQNTVQTQTIKSKSPPAKYSKPPRDYQSEKKILVVSRDEAENDVNKIQRNISSKRQTNELQRNRLIKKLQAQRKKNTLLQKQVTTKKKKNKEMKSIIDKIPSDKLQLQLNQYQNIIQSLTEVYSFIFKQQTHLINTQELVKKFKLVKSDESSLIEEWLVLHHNLKLKYEISIWQSNERQLKKSRQKVVQQKEVISKLVSNYVRQRYLWQWIKITAETL